MGKTYKRNCDRCGTFYTGRGKYYCCHDCSTKIADWTEDEIEYLKNNYTKMFYIQLAKNLEADGDAFHFNPAKYKADDRIFKTGKTAKEVWKRDRVRTQELQEKGYIVIRLWGSEIKKMNVEDLKIKINNSLKGGVN